MSVSIFKLYKMPWLNSLFWKSSFFFPIKCFLVPGEKKKLCYVSRYKVFCSPSHLRSRWCRDCCPAILCRLLPLYLWREVLIKAGRRPYFCEPLWPALLSQPFLFNPWFIGNGVSTGTYLRTLLTLVTPGNKNDTEVPGGLNETQGI